MTDTVHPAVIRDRKERELREHKKVLKATPSTISRMLLERRRVLAEIAKDPRPTGRPTNQGATRPRWPADWRSAFSSEAAE